ncbi:MAG TPA: M24 family metallopeptidase [Bryobacteraceae bacterium]|nr:M24 family metallopeptidase [Bryobacteraceae bacterium]
MSDMQHVDVASIQDAIRAEGIDGWLFFDHHRRDMLAYRVLRFEPTGHVTRRWYYFIPAQGEARGLVHGIESHTLDSLPGRKAVYGNWPSQKEGLAYLIDGARRIAMQYSPMCAIPYVSNVDAGTIELVRSLGVEIVSSADLIQQFEATWTDAQYRSHIEAGKLVDEIRGQAFRMIGERLAAGASVDEYAVKVFIREAFDRAGMVTDGGPIVGVNENMSDPHYEPESGTARPIRAGDAVLIDMWAKLNREHAVYYDITWTGFCGPSVPENIARVFGIVREARDRAVDTVRTAVASGRLLRGFEVDDAARGWIAGQGYGEYFIHRTGHSIGEDVHGTGANMDNFETHDVRRVIANTCFSVEPGVYLPEFGIRSEVNVFVGSGEAQVTGEAQQEMVRIGA